MSVYVVVAKKGAVRRTVVKFAATPKRGKKVLLPSPSAEPMGGWSS